MPSNHKKKKSRKPSSTHQPKGQGQEPNAVNSSIEEPLEERLDGNPYLVKRSDVVGRYIVASRDLKAGETITEVLPLIVGPCAESEPVCLGCHSTFEASCPVYRCETCSWRLCSPNCHSSSVAEGSHRLLECIPLRDKGVGKLLQTAPNDQVRLMYEAVLTLRCMLLKTIDPDRYARLLEMDPLNSVRQQIPKLWNRNQREIVARIRDEWGFEEFSEEELHTICGIIEVNAFEVGQEPVKARALFPEAYLLMHDCTPNTGHTDAPGTHRLTVRTLREVKAGQPLTLTYAYILQGTLKRRQHLKEEKFFWCNCARCSDPSELGTYCSALCCTKCQRGRILPVDPLNQQTDWRCQLCTHTMPCQAVILLLEKLFRELESIDGNDVEGYERFLRMQATVLHDNHYLILSAKHSLCELYGKIDGYLVPQLSGEQLKRKETLCQELLEVIDQLEPGMSRLRGTIMYEMHVPLMVEAGQLFQRGTIQRPELRRRLKEVQRLLRESERILALEPEGTPEHGIAVAAREALKNMGPV